MVKMLADVGAAKKSLVVLGEKDEKVMKSLANIPGVKVALVNTVNVYDILNADSFVAARGAVEKIEEVYA
jgi:large subunit ribosomal protein L4